ncbi:hypothetical protein ES708_05999 [subsurface metagenome]
MKVNIRKIDGPWDIGYYLDKHTIKSIYLGVDENGYPRYDTTRTEVGEALYQLKYKSDRNQASILATQLADSLGNYFRSASFIVPMPSSKQRGIQPVIEIARLVADKMHILCREDVLVKITQTAQMKDIPSKEDRVKALCSAFTVKDTLSEGRYDVLIIDDVYETGSSLDAATILLRRCDKIQKIYVATVTRTKS